MPLQKALRLCFLFILLSSRAAFSQPFGMEWIDSTRTYVKVPVTTTSLVRVTQTSLAAIGVNTGAIQPNNIKVHIWGDELNRLVTGGTDGLFNGSDYIEFVALGPDGSRDNQYYPSKVNQPNKLTNLHYDTVWAFISWGATGVGKDLVTFAEDRVGVQPISTIRASNFAVLRNEYSKGRGFIEQETRMQHSYFDKGEGWTGREFSQNLSLTNIDQQRELVVFNQIRDAIPGIQAPSLTIQIQGRNGRSHATRISVGTSLTNLVALDTIRFERWDFVTRNYTLPDNLVGATTLFVRAQSLNNPDRASICYAKLEYTQGFNLVNRTKADTLSLSPSATGYAKLALSNTANTLRIAALNSSGDTRLLGTFPQGNQVVVGVDQVNTGATVFLLPTTTTITPAQIKRVQFRRLSTIRGSYLMVSNRLLTQRSQQTGNRNHLADYAVYRASAAGGNHDTLLMFSDQLYDQFNYGENGPIAIRNWVRYLQSKGANPKFLTLIGKGLHLNNRFIAGFYQKNLVPTWGLPASDILFSDGLGSTPLGTPSLATGRIAAESVRDLASYLDKVRVHEQIGYRELWRKNAFIASGGRTQSELSQFRTFVQDYGSLIAARPYGGIPIIRSKSSANVIQFLDVTEIVNRGLSFLSIFGHSSPAGPDIDIGLPTDATYSNEGKYPLMMVNGCYTGNVYDDVRGINFSWQFTEKRGSIGFLANVDEGLPSFLDRYVDLTIRNMFADSANFGKPIGVIHQDIVRKFLAVSTSPIDTITTDQFSMQWDPAIVLFGPERADYKTSNAEVRMLTPNANANSSSFTLSVTISNLGKVVRDSLLVGVNRRLPSGQVRSFGPFKFAPVFNIDTIELTLPRIAEAISGGVNEFEVVLNPLRTVQELDLTNNSGTLSINLPAAAVRALLPKPFSIVTSTTANLLAQSSSLLGQERGFVFELDTNYKFTSPIRVSATIRGRGQALYPAILPVQRDSTVYYWRVRFAEQQTIADTTWSRSSFIYIAGSNPGWSQTAFPQLLGNSTIAMRKLEVQRQFAYEPTSARIRVIASGRNLNQFDLNRFNYLYDNTSLFVGNDAFTSCANGFRTPSMVTLALDPNNLQPTVFRYGTPQQIGNPINYSCGREPLSINYFTNGLMNSNLAVGFSFFQLRLDSLKSGDYVFMSNVANVSYPNWYAVGRQMRALAGVGIDTTRLKLLREGEPFVALGRKGWPVGRAKILLPNRNSAVPTESQTLQLDTSLTVTGNSGIMISPVVGPAAAWGSVQQYFNPSELNSRDRVTYSIIGQLSSGKDTVIYRDTTGIVDLSGLDAKLVPTLFIRGTFTDTQNGTPPNLRRWQVSYSPVPEGTLNTALQGLTLSAPANLQEGQTVRFRAAFQNIGGVAFRDSIPVQVIVLNRTNNNRKDFSFKLRPMRANDTIYFDLPSVNTLGLAGSNLLQLNVNPRVLPEEYYDNNQLEIAFEVEPDKTPPVLEVAFDGSRILDGDIVSAKPLITIRLRDDNKYLVRQDTLGMEIMLKRPNEQEAKRVSLISPELRYTIDKNRNEIFIQFQPQDLGNGVHSLNVRGVDASGNASGGLNYAINFNVVNESSITHFFPYPNPFSSQTRWVFTLTGSQAPEDLKIQIMTISGRVVREITRAELGPIRVGNNISVTAWDGTDEFGDKLANGVYLYRVFARLNGKSLEHRGTSADGLFKNGVGKLYIAR